MQKIVYVSPVFKGKVMIPAVALETYAKRDAAHMELTALGGIHGSPTKEFMKIRSKMLGASRKIQRNNWNCTTIFE